MNHVVAVARESKRNAVPRKTPLRKSAKAAAGPLATVTSTSPNDPEAEQGPSRYLGEIFCNRSLNMRSVKAVGFDMDYTLAHYKPETFERLAAVRSVRVRAWPDDRQEARQRDQNGPPQVRQTGVPRLSPPHQGRARRPVQSGGGRVVRLHRAGVRGGGHALLPAGRVSVQQDRRVQGCASGRHRQTVRRYLPRCATGGRPVSPRRLHQVANETFRPEDVPAHQLAVGLHQRGDEFPDGQRARRTARRLVAAVRRGHRGRQQTRFPDRSTPVDVPRRSEHAAGQAQQHRGHHRRPGGRFPARGARAAGRQLHAPARDPGIVVRQPGALRGRSHVQRYPALQAAAGMAHDAHHPGVATRDRCAAADGPAAASRGRPAHAA
eukprot:ctg_878.g381